MSIGKQGGISIPAVILHDAEGFPVTVETKVGEMYQGLLIESEENFNLHLKNVQYTDAKGKTTKLVAVFLRGSRIKMIILPELLQEAPVFQRVERFRASHGRYVPSGI
ncbi:hypothetical protein BASA81_002376 [Batrachochytrium salamandrivorans]|nr:hypothetical protein BASA81_002376 [Batrachochytrium salamandrivorans]